MVETHSYKLSPFGPALQFGGGSKVISASSFCMRLAEVPKAFEIFGFGLGSLRVSSLVVAAAEADDDPPPLPMPEEEFVDEPDEAGLLLPPTVALLPLRPRPVFDVEFVVALLVADILLAVTGGKLDARPVGVADGAVELVADGPPLVVEVEDIVALRRASVLRKIYQGAVIR